jgi:adenylate cyclase class 2
MSWEIEIKARLQTPQNLIDQLDASGQKGKSFHKLDVYFRGPTSLRLRYQEGVVWATSKEKTIKDGAEINRELEFRVGEEKAFLAWIAELGFVEIYRKSKSGWSWNWKGLTVEIVEVPPLGWYLEVEKVLEDQATRADQNQAHDEVLKMLEEFNVPQSAIEPKTWSQLLGFSSLVPPKEV